MRKAGQGPQVGSSGSIDELHQAVRSEAARASFPVETGVYEAAGRDPLHPILFGGRLDARLCFFARDLGKDEVVAGEPLKGAAGRMVRMGIYRHAGGQDEPTDEQLKACAQQVLLANTMPYKPPGNKAYTQQVKERFRPFITELLVTHFTGSLVITLGNEAFQWFSVCGPEVAAFWDRPADDRYEQTLPVTLRGVRRSKDLLLAPLPHPSPLNAAYYKRFPEMLQRRLRQLNLSFDLPAG